MKILREVEKIARSLSIIYANNLKELDLKRGQYVYIIFVNENPGLSQLDMVSQLNIDKTTVTKALQKLVSCGMVFRQRDSNDRRISRVYPTQYGREVYSRIREAEQNISQLLLESFTEREQFELENHLQKISKNLENEWKNSRSYLSIGIVKRAHMDDLTVFEDRLHYQPEHYYHVCEYREQIVGYMHSSVEPHPEYKDIRWNLNQEALYLEDIYILENYRKRGFGYQMIKEFETFASDMKIKHLRLVVDEKNIPMLKLVNMHEFKFIGEYVKEKNSHFSFEKTIGSNM